MTINKNISTAVTVAARMTKLQISATTAAQSINNLRFDVFEGTLTKEEKEALDRAQEICNRVSRDNSTHDILEYLTKLEA